MAILRTLLCLAMWFRAIAGTMEMQPLECHPAAPDMLIVSQALAGGTR